MTKNFCDRCGKEIVKSTSYLRYRIEYAKISFFYPVKPIDSEMDLCEECTNSLIDWMHEKEREELS